MKELSKKAGDTSDRVLARRGARELTLREAESVSGGARLVCTDVASLTYMTRTHTGCADNDGGSDTDVTF